MRLTLRVLLAYMHGILSEEDATEMDKKVAESEFAQKLITHIRTRVMRKELSALAVEGDGIGRDANSVAEYLDHKLDPQQVAQLEMLCFESDRHLAEVASAHQILTMVLGTPAHVSSSMRKRAYGLLGNSALLQTDSSTDLNQVLTPDDQRWNTTDDLPADNEEEDEQHLATAELPVAMVIQYEEENDVEEPEDEDEEELATASSGGIPKWLSFAAVVVLALTAGWLIAASGWIAPPAWLTGKAEQVAGATTGETPAAGAANGEQPPSENATPTQPDRGDISRDNINSLDDISAENEPMPQTPLSGQQPTTPPNTPTAATPPAMPDPGTTRSPAADQPFPSAPGGAPGAMPAAPQNPETIIPDQLEPGRRGVFLIHDIQTNTYAAPPRGATLKPLQRLIVAPGGYFATSDENAVAMIVVGPADLLQTPDGRVMVNHGQLSLPASEKPVTLEVVGGPQVTIQNIAEGGEVNVEIDRFMSSDMPPQSQGWLKIFCAGQCDVTVADVTLSMLPQDELIMYTDERPPVLKHRQLAPSWSVLYPSPAADFVRLKLDEAAQQGVDPLKALQRIAESNASPGVRSEAMRLSAEAGQVGPLVQSFHDPTLSQFWSAHYRDLAELWSRAEPKEKPQIVAALHDLNPQFGDALVNMLDSYWWDTLNQQEASELIVNLGHHEAAMRLFAFERLQRMTGYTLLYRPDMTEAEREGPISRWWGRMSAGQLAGRTVERMPK
ncbi:hypothetical protein [Blastopirellula retiformator]|nr:hypothetical protein [Blastopirellula retiformator]